MRPANESRQDRSSTRARDRSTSRAREASGAPARAAPEAKTRSASQGPAGNASSAQPRPKRAGGPPAPRPHAAFNVPVTCDADLRLAGEQAPPTHSSVDADGTAQARPFFIVDFAGPSPQDVLASYVLQCRTEGLASSQNASTEVSELSRPARGSRNPVEAVDASRARVAKPKEVDVQKRGAPSTQKRGARDGKSAAPPSAEKERPEWQNAEVWIATLHGDHQHLAARVPDMPSGQDQQAALVSCRLVHRHLTDWNKWSQLVRKDSNAWLGQLSMPIVLGLAMPQSVQCHTIVSDLQNFILRLGISWSIDSASQRLFVGPHLHWQYRWRLMPASAQANALADTTPHPWSLGPVMQQCLEPAGVYCSAQLCGEWSPLEGSPVQVICCVRYASIRSCSWSPWSVESPPVTLQLQPPSRRQDTVLTAQLIPSDPTRVMLVWDAFVPALSKIKFLEYRVWLRRAARADDPEHVRGSTEEQWVQIAWLEHPVTCSEPLRYCLHCLTPGTSYVARVEARHQGGRQNWSDCLEQVFTTSSSYISDQVLLPVEELGAVDSGATCGAGQPSNILCRVPLVKSEESTSQLEFEWRSCSKDSKSEIWRPAVWSLESASTEHVLAKVVFDKDQMDEMLLRYRVSTFASSAICVAPYLQTPAAPRVNLLVHDEAFSIEVVSYLNSNGHVLVNRGQVSCKAVGGSDHILELSSRAIQFQDGSFKLLVARGDLESCSVYQFRARVGCGFGWSAWSAPSSALEFAVKPPRPQPGSQLLVNSLGGSATSVELRWKSFLLHDGLAAVDYHIDVAPLLQPDDADELFLPGALVSSCGSCKASLEQLVPDTEYLFVVSASLPLLGHLSQIDEAANTLTTKFRTPPIDRAPLLPPLPPVQARSPEISQDSSESWMLWLRVDPRTVLPLGEEAVPEPRYCVQWRPYVDQASPWSWITASTVCDTYLPSDSDAMVHLDIAAADGNARSSDSTCRMNASHGLPEQVQVRLSLRTEMLRIRSSPHLWFSAPSAPIPVAYGAVPEPAVSLQWKHERLQVVVKFDMFLTSTWEACQYFGGNAQHAAYGTPCSDPAAHRPEVPIGFGHRSATQYQIRFAQLCEDGLKDSSLAESGKLSELHLEHLPVDSDINSEGLAIAAGHHRTQRCAALSAKDSVFQRGCQYAFSVRVGDTYCWSAWSPFSRPVVVDVTRPRSPTGELSATIPANRKVVLEWDHLLCDLGQIPVESCLWMVDLTASDEPSEVQAREEACRNRCSQVLVAHHWQKSDWQSDVFRPKVEVAIQGFQPGHLYCFELWARHDLTGYSPAEFEAVARSHSFHWRDRVDSEWCTCTDWSLPLPVQASVPDELEEHSTRWQGNAVLLAWPEGFSGDGRVTLELQARADSESEAHPVCGWFTVPWVRVRLSGIDYASVHDLKFQKGRFRWYDANRKACGPTSDPCLAYVVPPPVPSVEVICIKSSIRVHVQVLLPKQQHQLVEFFRMRYRLQAEVPVKWRSCEPRAVSSDDYRRIGVGFGEEDGLEQGLQYVFSMQVGCQGRRSQWSDESLPVLFDVPLAFDNLPAGAVLAVNATSLTSVTFRWPELVAPAVLSPRSLKPAGSPGLECRLDVSRCLEDGDLEHRTSILLEEDDRASGPPTQASVFNLAPATEYRALLLVRCARLGTRRWQSTGLIASFVTPQSDG